MADLDLDKYSKWRPVDVHTVEMGESFLVETLTSDIFRLIHISPGLEDEESTELPDLLAIYSNFLACCIRFAEDRKQNLKRVKAVVRFAFIGGTAPNILKHNPTLQTHVDTAMKSKMTADDKEAIICLSDEVIDAETQLNDAEYAVNCLSGVIDALKAKRDMLKIRGIS